MDLMYEGGDNPYNEGANYEATFYGYEHNADNLSFKAKQIYKVTNECIFGFFGPHRFLSNFHMCKVLYRGFTYPSTEHAYQIAKMAPPEVPDADFLNNYVHTYYPTPQEIKNWSKKLTVGPEWHKMKMQVMYEINLSKFGNHLDLRKQLLDTGNLYLEETNWWFDRFWGVCEGKGDNNLGVTLMRIRKEFR